MKYTRRMKKGFTLVELSIVLVIIGLLIGGILVGQSLIESAKIQSQVRQFQQFDAAVASFQSKYNSLPGDTALFSPAGDGDGSILDVNGDYIVFSGEIANFWVHLSQSGLKNENGSNYTATVSGGISPGINTPKPSIGNSSAVIIASYAGNPGTSYNLYAFALQAAPSINIEDLGDSGFALSPVQTLSLDMKMDDGIGDTGNVLGIDAVTSIESYSIQNISPQDVCVDASTGNYIVTSDDELCALSVRILSQVGQ